MMTFPRYGKIKVMFQTTNQPIVGFKNPLNQYIPPHLNLRLAVGRHAHGTLLEDTLQVVAARCWDVVLARAAILEIWEEVDTQQI